MDLKDVVEKKYRVIWLAIAVVGTALLCLNLTANTIWYDEAFIGSTVRSSLWDIIKISMGDKHPPLYFIVAKILTAILGDNPLALRLSSLLGVVALAGLGLSVVKRALGSQAGILFTLLVFVTPALVGQAQNARMYTWAAFFITACALYVYLAVTQNRRGDWIMLGVASVLGLYTHVYLMIELAVTYTLALAFILVCERRLLKRFVALSAAVAMLFLPWAYIVMAQVSNVAKDFWIPAPTSPWVLFGCFFAPFSHEFGPVLYRELVGLAALVGTALALLGVIHGIRTRKGAGLLALLCVGIAALTFVGAFIFSLVVTPILIPRYLVTLVGLYILVVTYGVLLLKKDALKVAAAALVVAAFAPQIVDIKTVQRNGPMAEIQKYLHGKLQPGDVFLHGEEQPFGLFNYYYPQHKHYLYLPADFEGYGNYEAFKPSGAYGHDYRGFIRQASRIWVTNRLGETFFRVPKIEDDELLRAGLYKATPTQRFSQDHSFLVLGLAKFSTDPKDATEETSLEGGTIAELKFSISGFKNDSGTARLAIYNRELYRMSDGYLWQGKLPDTIEAKAFNVVVTNSDLLSDDEKKYLGSFYRHTDGQYKLLRQLSEQDGGTFGSIYTKLCRGQSKSISRGTTELVLKDLPKGQYFISVFHDENANGRLDYKDNSTPLEGVAVSDAYNGLRSPPSFDTNSIVLDGSVSLQLLKVFYY